MPEHSDSLGRFTLNRIELLDSPFATTREKVRLYLIGFPVERLLHSFRLNAGLPSIAEPLGGWERPDSKVRGQFAGHFLSACARFAATGESPELLETSRRIVDEFIECQRAMGGEYLSAFPESEFDVLEERRDEGVWAPYYVLHKIMQSLIDCYLLCANQKALDVAIGMAAFCNRRMSPLSRWQIDGILRCTKINPKNEFGGMSDVLHRLYQITGNQNHLEIAHLFDRPYFLDPLAEGIDVLSDLHANTHIPMISGAARHYEITGDNRYRSVVENFWKILDDGYTYANGNSSGPSAVFQGGTSDKSEHWGAPGMLSRTLRGGECESCCGHNTRKVAGDLFRWTRDVKYGNHIEQLMYNSVLNSASRLTGMSLYHQPLGTVASKVFGTRYDSFWCCTGSGVEAYSEIQSDIFYRTDYGILVNLLIPAVLDVQELGVKIESRGDFPIHDSAELTIRTESMQKFELIFRCPSWIVSAPEISINNEPVSGDNSNDNYLILDNAWNDGDTISVRFPMDIHASPMPDNPNMAAYLYGPVLLAVLSDHEVFFDGASTPIRRTSDNALRFSVNTSAGEVLLLPLYEVEEQPYSVYIRSSSGGHSDVHASRTTNAVDGEAAYA